MLALCHLYINTLSPNLWFSASLPKLLQAQPLNLPHILEPPRPPHSPTIYDLANPNSLTIRLLLQHNFGQSRTMAAILFHRGCHEQPVTSWTINHIRNNQQRHEQSTTDPLANTVRSSCTNHQWTNLSFAEPIDSMTDNHIYYVMKERHFLGLAKFVWSKSDQNWQISDHFNSQWKWRAGEPAYVAYKTIDGIKMQ